MSQPSWISKDYPRNEAEYMSGLCKYLRRNMNYYMYQPENYMISLNSYESSLLFYGRTKISVYSIDSNYLNYLYKSDGYTHGGVVGGIGVFGSKSGKVLYTKVMQ